MKIEISSATVAPMAAWLREARQSGVRDEKMLRQILSMPDYEIEFRRYGEPNLPVCGIRFEEAVDFFLHFDEKDFDNPRLALDLLRLGSNSAESVILKEKPYEIPEKCG